MRGEPLEYDVLLTQFLQVLDIFSFERFRVGWRKSVRLEIDRSATNRFYREYLPDCSHERRALSCCSTLFGRTLQCYYAGDIFQVKGYFLDVFPVHSFVIAPL